MQGIQPNIFILILIQRHQEQHAVDTGRSEKCTEERMKGIKKNITL